MSVWRKPIYLILGRGYVPSTLEISASTVDWPTVDADAVNVDVVELIVDRNLRI